MVGCSNGNEAAEIVDIIDIVTNEDPFAFWANDFPVYYSEIDAELYEEITSALETGDEEVCSTLAEEEISTSTAKTAIECRFLLTKLLAFDDKNSELCDDLYFGEEDTIEYEECLAPIAAYSAISFGEISTCKEFLTNARLINLCEGDYETYS